MQPFESLYELEEELGNGQSAVVHRVIEKSSGINFAGKFVRKRRGSTAEAEVKRESNVLATLRHPNLVALHETFETPQHIVFVIELVSGGELETVLDAHGGKLIENDSIDVIGQILNGLEFMHSHGIAHLDLKPENVMISKLNRPWQVKLIDFGLSRQVQGETERALQGTPEFLAPEAVNFEPLSLATDIWAVGVIAYYILTGISPFLGEDKQETFCNIVAVDYDYDKIANISSLAASFVSRLLIQNPRKRPQAKDCINDPWLVNIIDQKEATFKSNKILKNRWKVWFHVISITNYLSSKISITTKATENLIDNNDTQQQTEEIIISMATSNYNNNEIIIPKTTTSAVVDESVNLNNAISEGKLENPDDKGETAIFWAARQGNVEAVKILVVAGAKINAENHLGETCLHVACRYGHASVVGTLCSYPIDLDHRDHTGETALHAACSRGHTECAKRLIDSGASMDIQDHRYAATPLMMALQRHQTRVALLLLHAGADLDLADINGDTPLHVASREGILPVTQTLCAYGCRVDLLNEAGFMAVHLAAKRGHTEVVRCLCLAGCDIEKRNSDGIKAEITALKHGHTDTAELLSRLTNMRQRDEYIKQLIPGTTSLNRLTIKVLGHSGVGKSTLIESLGAGLFASLFKRSRGTSSPTSRSNPTSPSKTQIEMDVTDRYRDEMIFSDSKISQGGTKGIDVRMISVAGIGEVSAWEFSGQEAYLPGHHYLLNICADSALHVLVCSLEDPPAARLQQCLFWLNFIQARVPLNEPFSAGGTPRNPIRVVLVATHADSVRCPRALHAGGEYVCTEIDWLLEQLSCKVNPAIQLYPRAHVLDAHVPGAPGMRTLKSCLMEAKQRSKQLSKYKTTGLLESTVRWLAQWRRTTTFYPVSEWEGFIKLIHSNINPLAGEDHLKELLHQLVFLGEAVWLRSSNLVILCPNWMGTELLGQLLSPEFLATARATGCYTVDDFQATFPHDAQQVLQVLEALDLCVQCEIDGEIEYEFPCFNLVETLDGLWDSEDPRYTDAVYAGVRLRTSVHHQLYCLFPRIQVQLRRAAQSAPAEPETDLYQWLHGSKLCSGLIESLITLERGGDIEIKVRGPTRMRLACFYFMEDLLAVVEHALDSVIPGIQLERRILSSDQLSDHILEPYSWSPKQINEVAMNTGAAGLLSCCIRNEDTDTDENLLDLIAFGAPEAASVIVMGADLPATALSLTAKQILCQSLDPPEALGRDWCLLAVSMGLNDRLASLESGTADGSGKPSPTARLLDEWAHATKSATIGLLVEKLKELGREDVGAELLQLSPIYKVLPNEEYWTDEEEEDALMETTSSNVSR